jgi:hypothetical protein
LRPRRIGLFVDRQQSSLVAAIRAGLARNQLHAPVHLVARSAPDEPDARAYLLVDRAFSRLLHGAHFAPDAATDYTDLDTLVVDSITSPSPRDLEQFAARNVDTLIICTSLQVADALLMAVGNEVFFIDIGSPALGQASSAGLSAIFAKDAVVPLAIRRATSARSWQIVATSTVQTHAVSAHLTRENILVGVRELIALTFDQRRATTATNVPIEERGLKPSHIPSVWQQARQTASIIGAVGRRAISRPQWLMAFAPIGKNDSPLVPPTKWTPLIPPPDRIWADPFIVDHDDDSWLFFEEAPNRSSKGRGVGHIAVTKLTAHGITGPIERALDLPYHLSYPFTFEHGGDWFLIPESSTQRRIDLFRCTHWPNGWEFVKTLVSGISGVDSSLVFSNGLWWMFVATSAAGAPTADYLRIFFAETLLGPWREHRASPVVADASCARPAGRPFFHEGALWRPSQGCAGGIYGRDVRFQRIIRLTLDDFAEVPCGSFEPTWMPGIFGTHTYNRSERFAVVDGCRNQPRIGRSELRSLIDRAPNGRRSTQLETS